MTENPERPRLLRMTDPDVARAHAQADVEPLEIRVGRHFARENEETLCFNHTSGKWLEWTGMRWREDETALHLDRMMAFTNTLRITDPVRRKALGALGFNNNALRVAAADRSMARKGSDFDADPLLAGTPTGYIDLRTGKHHAPDRSKMISLSTGVSPADTANCPKWVEFLNWATANDAEMVRYLQKFFGYCLSGKMNEEIMTFIHGPGGNGKGVMLSVIGKIMGEYYLSTPSSTFMASTHQEHATELARLQHRRLVSASETNEGDKWNVARIKEITGNENPISARFMRQDFFEFWPVCKLVIIGNSKPALDDVDPAMARRLRLIEFLQTPAAVNVGLKEEFNGEFSSILRWVIDGYQLYAKEGLQPPTAVRHASQSYLGDQDLVGQFIMDFCEIREGGVLVKSDVGLALAAWMRENGVTKKVPATRVYKKLEEVYKVEHGDSVRYNGRRCFRGVNLTAVAWQAIQKDLRRQNSDLEPRDGLRGLGDLGQKD